MFTTDIKRFADYHNFTYIYNVIQAVNCDAYSGNRPNETQNYYERTKIFTNILIFLMADVFISPVAKKPPKLQQNATILSMYKNAINPFSGRGTW